MSVQQAGLVAFELDLLSVDGGRSVLPLPRTHDDLRVTRLQDVVARIVKGNDDTGYPYDRYMEQARLHVVDTSERRAA